MTGLITPGLRVGAAAGADAPDGARGRRRRGARLGRAAASHDRAPALYQVLTYVHPVEYGTSQ
jgi:hypothetical protein